jgi:hypothetical protein
MLMGFFLSGDEQSEASYRFLSTSTCAWDVLKSNSSFYPYRVSYIHMSCPQVPVIPWPFFYMIYFKYVLFMKIDENLVS